jgi:hypothetical protein
LGLAYRDFLGVVEMRKCTYARPNCPACPADYNRGEQVEWRVGYELTGEPGERNNKPGAAGGDVLEWQVKSPKASLVEQDNCGGYIFGFADADYYYQMTKAEFEEFLGQFSYIDRDSKTGKAKVRIKNDSSKMRKWLMDRA